MLGITLLSVEARARTPNADVVSFIDVSGPIDPPSASFIIDQVRRADSNGNRALIVHLDTEAGAEAPVARLINTLTAAKTPIIVWVGPLKAASAGTLIAASADILSMTPGSFLGPLHPSDLSHPTDLRPSAEVGLLSSAAHGRSKATALSTLRSREISAEAAQRAGIADFISPTLPSLLESLRGLDVPGHGPLPDRPIIPEFRKMPLFQRLLHAAVSPVAAYLLILLGLFGLVFELYNPGVGGGALSGGVALGFGLYGFSILPTRWPALALLTVGLLLLLFDLQTARLGRYSVLGAAAFLVGSIGLFPTNAGPLRLPWWMIVAGSASLAAFFLGAMPAAIRARTARPITGSGNLVGTSGVARSDISPDGQVMAGGTLWRARTLGAAIPEGAVVNIKGVSGLVLMVEEGAPEG